MGIWQHLRNTIHKKRVSRTAADLIHRFGLDCAWVEAGKRHLDLTKSGRHQECLLWREVADQIVHEIKLRRR